MRTLIVYKVLPY